MLRNGDAGVGRLLEQSRGERELLPIQGRDTDSALCIHISGFRRGA
jgi:hypothetical protein